MLRLKVVFGTDFNYRYFDHGPITVRIDDAFNLASISNAIKFGVVYGNFSRGF